MEDIWERDTGAGAYLAAPLLVAAPPPVSTVVTLTLFFPSSDTCSCIRYLSSWTALSVALPTGAFPVGPAPFTALFADPAPCPFLDTWKSAWCCLGSFEGYVFREV